MATAEVINGDCLEVLRGMEAGSFDAVVTDPPYPCIDRPYGRWTEAEWFALMDPLVAECRRLLKPLGSAVFVLQPNSERVGRMRTWLWEFMARWGREWGVVQDAYWLNDKPLPEAHAIQGRLMRPSVKPCVWLGLHDCYRNQDSVLWEEAASVKLRRMAERASGRLGGRHESPSGHGVDTLTKFDAAERRGGVTPLNVFVANHERSQTSAGAHGHGAGTPLALCRWWVRYICPPGGRVLDPFLGSGTTALACLREGRDCVGVERVAEYVDIARRRIADALAESASATPLFDATDPAP